MQYKIYKKVYEKNSYTFKWVIGTNLQFFKKSNLINKNNFKLLFNFEFISIFLSECCKFSIRKPFF